MSDDFERTGGVLGDNWTTTYSGSGELAVRGERAEWCDTPIPDKVSVRISDHVTLNSCVYGRMDFQSDTPPGKRVGARITAMTHCEWCGRPPENGDVFTADLKPDMAGTWHHNDCDDPKLEHDA